MAIPEKKIWLTIEDYTLDFIVELLDYYAKKIMRLPNNSFSRDRVKEQLLNGSSAARDEMIVDLNNNTQVNNFFEKIDSYRAKVKMEDSKKLLEILNRFILSAKESNFCNIVDAQPVSPRKDVVGKIVGFFTALNKTRQTEVKELLDIIADIRKETKLSTLAVNPILDRIDTEAEEYKEKCSEELAAALAAKASYVSSNRS